MSNQPKHKRMTAKECKAAKERRAIELAATIASIPKYIPKTAKESQETADSYRNALGVIGKEIERLETIEQLDKILLMEPVNPRTALEELWKL